MDFAAGIAFADHQLAFFRRFPDSGSLPVFRDCGCLGFGLGGLDLAPLALHLPHPRPMMTVAEPCRVPSEPPVPCANARSQFLTCTAGCASPRNCRTASTTLVRPPRL